MSAEWREVTVDDVKAESENSLATGPFGSSIGSRFFTNSGVPVIRGSNLSEDIGIRLNDQGLVFLSPDKALQFSRSKVRDGDLVFTCWGTVNQVGLIDKRAAYPEYIISNKQMKLTPNPAKADSLFLYYMFSSPELQERIKNESIGSSVPGFNLGQLRSMRIRIPELDEQHAIARVLGTLDDKIELNRKMNETLEAMARALFKSWFVDFDPVRAKAQGRDPGLPKHLADLFPNSFEECELGDIPKGWHISRLGEIASMQRGTLNPGAFPEEVFDHYSIPAYDEGREPKVETGEQIKSNKFLIPPGAVMISKLNPRFPRVWLPELSSIRRSVCSTEFIVLAPKSMSTIQYLYCLCISEWFFDTFATLVTGTSSSHQRVKPDDLLRMQVAVPSSNVVGKFSDLVAPLLRQVIKRAEGSRTLAALRDALLPKLISGEIRVKR
ncbi:MAG TPA: restriction endonuclease subunit S [Terriglobia bacterium]|nr:restriction endonuclease subunit S [Terriglobia bacterium]